MTEDKVTSSSKPNTPNNCYNRGPYVDPPADSVIHATLPDCQGRILIVGDPHGCFDEFMELIKHCSITPDDMVVVVGDLVNKGPKSIELVQFVRNTPNFYSVMGNHEGFAIMWWEKWINGEVQKDDIPHTVRWVCSVNPEDMEWLKRLPYSISIPQYNTIVVHAGVHPGVPLQDQHLGLMYRLRNIATYTETTPESDLGRDVCGNKPVTHMILSERSDVGTAWIEHWKGPQHVFFGHDAVRKLQRTNYATGLDTGCCYGFHLSGCLLPTFEIKQVEAREVYDVPGLRE